MGLVVFAASNAWLAVGYSDLPALDGARDLTHSLSLLVEHERRPSIPNAQVDGSVLDALRLRLCVGGFSLVMVSGDMFAEL